MSKRFSLNEIFLNFYKKITLKDIIKYFKCYLNFFRVLGTYPIVNVLHLRILLIRFLIITNKIKLIYLKLDKIYPGTWNEKLEYSVWYKTNKEDFKLFKDKLNTQKIYELDFNNLELQEDEYIIEFEFRFGKVKVDFKEIESPIVFVNMLDNLKNGFTFTNNTKVSGNYLEEYIEDKDKWTTIIYNREVKINEELPKTGIKNK